MARTRNEKTVCEKRPSAACDGPVLILPLPSREREIKEGVSIAGALHLSIFNRP
jgi:hypothetical protein